MSADEKLKKTFEQALGMAPDADFEEAKYGDTEGWDSAAHMALIAEIEGAFDIMLDTDEVIGMSSFWKAREFVANHGIAFV
jgi:acyl carrier protein